MDKHLHIVCFDVPYPADYGGVIDIFYRIKSLYELGVKIHLHCFNYGRGVKPELNKYCVEVTYYKRNQDFKGFSFSLPYIVHSRANKILLHNLLKDDHPVLLEGIHCTYFLYTNQLKNKKVFVRLHNVEFRYYRELAKTETSLFKKMYFKNESRLLKKYEKNIACRAALLAINKKDSEIYQNVFGSTDIKHLAPFIPDIIIRSKEGKGTYCLYHGNLSVAENEKAAIWLSENVFHQLSIPFVVAGKNPSKKLKSVADRNKNITVISNLSEEEMTKLVTDAQINIIPSFNSTGVKIKLLNALFSGRHCIVNKATVDGTGLENMCHVAENKDDYISMIEEFFDQPFSSTEIEIRNQILKYEFDNKRNAETLMQWIY